MRSPLRYPEKGNSQQSGCLQGVPERHAAHPSHATTWYKPSQFRLVAFTRHLKEAKISNPVFFFFPLPTTTEGGPHSTHTHFSTRMETFRSPHGELGWETGTTSSIPGRIDDRQAQAQSITHSPPGPSCPDRDKARRRSCWYKDMYSTPR